MKLINTCSLYFNKEILSVLDLVRPDGIKINILEVNSSAKSKLDCAGVTYTENAEIVISILPDINFPIHTVYSKRPKYPKITLYDYRELLTYILAHETRHVWQEQIGKHHKELYAKGSRGTYSEYDCEVYALTKLKVLC